MTTGSRVAQANLSFDIFHRLVVIDRQGWKIILIEMFSDAQHFGVVFGSGWHFTRPQKDLEADICKGEFITGEQGTASHSLAIHLGPVCTTKVANKEQTIGAGDRTVQLGDAGMLQCDVTLPPLPPHQSHLADDQESRRAIQRDELRDHVGT